MKRVIAVVVLLAVGAVLGIFGSRAFGAGEDARAGELELYGNVEMRDAQLAFVDRERIASVSVEEGDRLETGDLVATLRTDRLLEEIASADARILAQRALVAELENGTRPQEIEQARAAVASARARLANSEREEARIAATIDTGASTESELDAIRARVEIERAELERQEQGLALAVEGPRVEARDAARATLEQLEAERALLGRRLADAELRAPSRGVVRTRLLEPGEFAAPERPVVTLALDDPKWIRAFVPEPSLGRVALGTPARIRTDTFPGRDYVGRVGFISPVAEFTPRTVETEELRTRLVYEVRIVVEDPHDELRLGMPVTVLVAARDGGGEGAGEGR
jgi:HlyD family secretion protein